MTQHLLVAHGSPDSRHRESMQLVAKSVDALAPSTQVAFLEHDEPRVGPWLGTRPPGDEVVVLGMLLAPGYHASVDVPRLIAQGSDSLTLVDRGVLGTGPWLNQTLDWLVADAGGDRGTPVVLAVAGSTRPEAGQSLAGFAEQWRSSRSGGVHVAAATGPGPSLGAVLAAATGTRAASADIPTPIVLPLMIAPGVLADRARAVAARHGLATTATLADSPHFAEAVATRLTL